MWRPLRVEQGLRDLLDPCADDAVALLDGQGVGGGFQLDDRPFSERARVDIGLEIDRGR
jgi:hypothetical protein